MGVKNTAFLGAHAIANLALHFEDLLAGLDEGAFEAVDFLMQMFIADFVLGDRAMCAAEHKDFAAANPCGNGNTPKHFLTLVGWLWHGQSLHGTRGIEKIFFNRMLNGSR
jgi:hypothetical protein